MRVLFFLAFVIIWSLLQPDVSEQTSDDVSVSHINIHNSVVSRNAQGACPVCKIAIRSQTVTLRGHPNICNSFYSLIMYLETGVRSREWHEKSMVIYGG